MKYGGSSRPAWDTTNHEWEVSTANDGWMEYNQRHNSKFRQDTFLYTPTSEGTLGYPGDSWIGVYFDASWWADTAAFHLLWADQTWDTSGVTRGTMCVGLLPFYPRGNDEDYSGKSGGSFEVPRNHPDVFGMPNHSSSISTGGGLMIELVEEV
jgi:hypothetical protein